MLSYRCSPLAPIHRRRPRLPPQPLWKLAAPLHTRSGYPAIEKRYAKDTAVDVHDVPSSPAHTTSLGVARRLPTRRPRVPITTALPIPRSRLINPAYLWIAQRGTHTPPPGIDVPHLARPHPSLKHTTHARAGITRTLGAPPPPNRELILRTTRRHPLARISASTASSASPSLSACPPCRCSTIRLGMHDGRGQHARRDLRAAQDTPRARLSTANVFISAYTVSSVSSGPCRCSPAHPGSLLVQRPSAPAVLKASILSPSPRRPPPSPTLPRIKKKAPPTNKKWPPTQKRRRKRKIKRRMHHPPLLLDHLVVLAQRGAEDDARHANHARQATHTPNLPPRRSSLNTAHCPSSADTAGPLVRGLRNHRLRTRRSRSSSPPGAARLHGRSRSRPHPHSTIDWDWAPTKLCLHPCLRRYDTHAALLDSQLAHDPHERRVPVPVLHPPPPCLGTRGNSSSPRTRTSSAPVYLDSTSALSAASSVHGTVPSPHSAADAETAPAAAAAHVRAPRVCHAKISVRPSLAARSSRARHPQR
ncbi:hypothetical protein B0H17DRAFT_1206493 [Mycena rosella]|uniref:Uncharacterized protein n=1 Tax=Mycena rosella TaxID=1033263 RepID=A0AAD7D4T5_MYCRO|nr:hypothetical protein B0H17DRAFT_1206493 [Mycena rosella]